MAKTNTPLMSLDASGTVGGAITFATWKGRKYVRQTVTPANPKSGTQKGVRATLKWSTQQYKNIGATAQGHWLAQAKATNITALNAMVQENQTRGRQDKPPYKDPTITTATAEPTPAAPAATAQPVSIKITWTDSTGAADWGTAIYANKGSAPTTGPATLIAMVARGTQAFIHAELKTGDTWHYKVRGFSTDGTFSADSADVNATVL